MADLPDVLRLTEMGERRFEVTQAAAAAETPPHNCAGAFPITVTTW